MDQLRESVTLPVAEQRHPVLMNAIFLWACFVSRPGPFSQHETHYLTCTLEALAESLQHPDKIVDIVLALCLLSTYFLSNGRMLEGSYHATAAASLAVQYGLHGGTSQKNNWCLESMDSFKIESTKDASGDDERILAFWQAYNLDCCWSVVLHKPPTIRDARIAFNSINTPWPQNVDQYEPVSITISMLPFSGVNSLYNRLTSVRSTIFRPLKHSPKRQLVGYRQFFRHLLCALRPPLFLSEPTDYLRAGTLVSSSIVILYPPADSE